MIGDFSVAHFVFLGFSPPDARDVELRGAKRRNGYCEFGFGRFAGVEQDPRAYRDPRAARCGSSVRQLGAAVRQHSERAEPDPASPPQPASRRPGAIGRGGGGGGGGGGGRACADGVCGDGAGLAARSLVPPGFHTECAPYGIHRVKKQNGERVNC